MAFKKTPQLSAKDIARFWSLVTKTDMCWLWSGPRSTCRFRFSVGNQSYSAKRIAWGLTKGELPDDVMLANKGCGTSACIKPDCHRQYKSVIDYDKINRKAHASLSAETVREIKIRVFNGELFKDVAKEKGIPCTTVWYFCSGLTWKDIEPCGNLIKLRTKRRVLDWKVCEQGRLMKDKRFTNREIADALKLSMTTVKTMFRRRRLHAYPFNYHQRTKLRHLIAKYGVKRVSKVARVSTMALEMLDPDFGKEPQAASVEQEVNPEYVNQ